MNRDDLMSHQKAINQEMSVELPVDKLGTGRWTFRSPLNDMRTEIAQGSRRGLHSCEFYTYCKKSVKKKAQSAFEVLTFSKRQEWVNQTSHLQCRHAPHHWYWIVGRPRSCMGLHTSAGSHILSILLMQIRASPHMQWADPAFEKEACRSHA